jgi:superfamily II DNA or RNA helicase
MSIVSEVLKLSPEKLSQIHKEVEIIIENKFGLGQPRYIYPYKLEGDNITLPFAFGTTIPGLLRPPRANFPIMNVKFTGKLREEQKIVRKEALVKLSSKGSIMISAYPGFGKTCGAINLATSISFKTMVIVNKIILIKQWEESIKKFSPDATIQLVSVGDSLKDADFYIINAQNVEKMGKRFFQNIGCCIVDEAHMIMAETLSKCLQYIYPRYLIGLTATPYRPDGLDKLLELYFGKYKIIRKLFCPHTVYKVKTNFKPPLEKTIHGRLNWGAILDAQANNNERNQLIVKIITSFPDRNFLVLVKRVAQGEYLLKTLQSLGESVTNLIGSNQKFEKSARILVGTCQKVGVGFDHATMDTLILAADIEEYFIQYLGRVFRTKDVKPIIFDLIDDNSVLSKHFNTRQTIYREHGGDIKEFNFKDFVNL